MILVLGILFAIIVLGILFALKFTLNKPIKFLYFGVLILLLVLHYADIIWVGKCLTGNLYVCVSGPVTLTMLNAWLILGLVYLLTKLVKKSVR